MSSLNNGVIQVSLHHFLAAILIVAPLGAILILVITILLFFTPTESRKRPVFILNILACFLGACQAIFFACLNSYVILHPDKPISHTFALAAIAILLGPPILIDGILLVRVFAFYPVQLTSPPTLFVIFMPTFLWKVARFGCLMAFIATYPIDRFNGPSYVTLPGLVWGCGPWIVTLLGLQVADNTFMSAIFLCKLYQYGYHKRKAHDKSIAPAIFTIALGNYVIPLTIDVTMILLAALLLGWFSGAYIIIFVANFVSIIGIVFATAWAVNSSTKMRRLVKFNAGAHARTACTTIQLPVASIADTFSVDNPRVAGPLLSSSVSHTSGLVSQGDTQAGSSASSSTSHV